ncbi:helix-loop-helix DNA-binding domain-domain-containing protein [Catenaria anguillulae PL171]|uniref:Helix-loop-helix DNA-binding domain-domain-containing protein n=1 Tax=Catenaria anguillulae PL171 TaxID=765915 RepID=A0A1Y2HYB1_9FUNG|nr:helix-loop-helix DNA-binding domain-domain-containing protein [Catenaria anguillulae PL171]
MSLPTGLGGMDWMSSVGSPLATSFDHGAGGSSYQPQSPAPGAGGPMLGSSFQAASSVPVPLQVGTPTTPGFMQIGSHASSLPFSMTGSPVMSTFFEADELDPSSKPMQVIFEKRRRRRESHNAVERRRRDNINERIAELGLLLPEYYVGSDPNVKPNKGQILRKVVDYVRHVQQTLKEAMDRQAELEGALRNLGVNPPASELGHTMKALLTLPQHSIAALAQLAQQQQQQHQVQGGGSSLGQDGGNDGGGQGGQESMSPGAQAGGIGGGGSGGQQGDAGGALQSTAGSQPGTPLGGQMMQSPVSTAGGEHPMNMSMSPTVMQQTFGFQQHTDYMDHSGAGGGGGSGQHSPQFVTQQGGGAGAQQQGGQPGQGQQVVVMYPNGMGGIVPLQGHGLVSVLPPQSQQRT